MESIDWITEYKPIAAKWHYTENELPEEDEECFCDAGDFFGYCTFTFCDGEFLDKECLPFKVTRWARVSELIAMLDKNT